MLLKDSIQKIKNFYHTKKRLPSYSESMLLLGYRSKNAVFKLINKMVEADLLEKDSSGRLTAKGLAEPLRVLGLVEAGFPSPAEEETTDTLSLDDYLIENKEATFMLTVKGDSMQDAGILAGDMVLAERKESAKDGEIVIAEVDGEWTMKYLRKRGSSIFLEPANPKYRPIQAENNLRVAAVVKAVIRKYR